ncbi:ATP-binding protein [Streptomyces paradoxus]|uniref:Putative ATPase/DNA-binding CsgD family transcriptional regulator n=1 Tax=Streptomyces paradoxus TaxID=66375 RepID=A0A7W9TAT2_9ACTN|nr:LuxR C-terminal-related transcriptional regulator [Streptomyces paradoxus]MBB6076603.1 putative ATPase/DNA-binding CsgD family transcriptional regulator [Streptomyces paradoxus]
MGGSAPRRDHHLPAETTSFVDRRGELTQGRELLARARLVTLTGPGGVGKTRLAARIAARVRRAFPDGVRFVHLSGLHDPALVPLAAADALGLHDRSAQPPLDALVEQVRDRRLLLVVDNCEHLAGACVRLAAALLHGTEGVRILATSRHRLGLTEEHLLEVRPLPVPDPDGDLSAAEGYPALTLFADRAAAVVPGFRLTPANRASVARLCHRLDGLPLAIELAAVRMRVLDVDQLLDRLDDRYRFLTTGSPAALPRHQTLRAAVAWSHDLCTLPEQTVWARLSVLAGSFDLETAEAVCADTGPGGDARIPEGAARLLALPHAAPPALPARPTAGSGAHAPPAAAPTGTLTLLPPAGLRRDDVLEAVAGLVDKSVLCRETGPGGVRYRLLDTLRQYGLEQLRRGTGQEEAARRRQRDWMALRAEECERGWFGPGQPETAALLRADQDNLRAALDFSLTAPGEALAGLRLAGTLWFHWHACGASREGLYWLDRALAAAPEPTRERARGLWVAGLLAAATRDFPRGRRHATDALALARALGDTAEAAHAEYVIGVIRLFGDDLPGALRHFEATVARGPVPGQHLSLVGLDQVELACALGFLGEAERAVEVCEQALRLCERHGEQWVRSYVLRMLALAHTVRGDLPRAQRHAREALRLKLAVHDVIGIALTLDLLASIAAQRGAAEHAAVLLGGADRVWADIDTGRWGSHTLNSVRRDSEELAGRVLGREAFERAHRRGGALGLRELAGHALQEPGRPPGAEAADPPPYGDTTARLTRRETEVARLVAEGLANQQIADRLVISRRTAEGHVERILGKLGFSNRSQIAAWMTAQR